MFIQAFITLVWPTFTLNIKENTAILKEWFDRVDSENTGSITAHQLKLVLKVGWMHDFDRNGTMSFQEFVALNKFLLKVQQAFADLERPVVLNAKHHVFLPFHDRGRGFLVPDEVYEALLKVGFSLDSPAFYTVLESFDQKKNGRFQLDDFISLCIFVHSARNLFNSFDTSKQGRVTLDLNQFIYCSQYADSTVIFNYLHLLKAAT
ncbi:hypothetical protein RJ639_011504 [Escallonia herrerae]|uniref:EF-hand domain-containing protein n=1 Tax=Escallonia herrerae TaxID=1293975 RepID=A0AA88VSA8_9ASTE|nr:hypothetical protein RJ639_011504 [Escallonia herrerae]